VRHVPRSPVKTVEKQGSRFQKGGWAIRTAARKVRAIGLPSLVVPAVIDKLIGNDRIGRLGDMLGAEAAIRVFILGESAPQPKLTSFSERTNNEAIARGETEI
jgi:hypothetical protein